MPLSVTVGSGVDCVIHLKNAWLTTYGELPNIKLGTGSRVRIVCSGEDHIDGRGIYVPEGSSLELEAQVSFMSDQSRRIAMQ